MSESAEIIGHAPVLEALNRDLAAGNLAHAYLFAGPRHVGKVTVARWFAHQILLQGLEGEQRAQAAHQLDRLIHGDFLVLDQLWIEDECDDWDVIARTSNVPQEHRAKREPPMKTDTISIDDVRALQERLFATGSGAHKVCLIRSVERMQDEAANALLKILEEPPPGRIFILTTQNMAVLLPTVISRCRVVQFSPVPHRDLLGMLAGEAVEDQGFLLHLAQGSPGTLKTLLSDPDARRQERLLHTSARAFWGESSLAARLKALDPLMKRGAQAEAFLRHLYLALHEAPPADPVSAAEALFQLSRDLETNAHRGLLCARFALSVTPG